MSQSTLTAKEQISSIWDLGGLTWRELGRVREAGVPVTVFEPGASELELMHYDAFDLTHRVDVARRAHDAAAARVTAPAAQPALVSVKPA